MKRILSIIFAISVALSLVGCSNSKPDVVVNSFCTALQSFDFESARTYTENGADILSDQYNDSEMKEDLSSEQVVEYLKDCAAKMTFTIGKSMVDGEKATVPVSFSYVDASPVITSVLGEYITQAIGLAFSGADDTQMETLFANIFADKIKSIDVGTASGDIVFNCVKADGDWKISSFSEEDENTLADVITCNITSTFENFGGEFGDSEENEDTSSIAWHDVALGEELELATLKICVTDCEERSELSEEYVDPMVAQEGTKFVVFFVNLENITNNTINFDNDFVLTDSQGRNYNPYSDAM